MHCLLGEKGEKLKPFVEKNKNRQKEKKKTKIPVLLRLLIN